MYPALFDRLAQPEKGEAKWTPDELKKLAGLNFVRVLQAVEQVGVQFDSFLWWSQKFDTVRCSV